MTNWYLKLLLQFMNEHTQNYKEMLQLHQLICEIKSSYAFHYAPNAYFSFSKCI